MSSSAPPPENPSDSGSPKYKGVRKRKWGKWVSEIRLPNSRERIWLGSYDRPEKAARAFDAALFCLRGSSASFNFPDDPPDIPGGRSLSPAEIQAVASRYGNDVVAHNTAHRAACGTTSGGGTSEVSDRGHRHVELMDWSILSTLNMLDCNEYYYPPPIDFDRADDDADEQQNYEDISSTSFLWNF